MMPVAAVRGGAFEQIGDFLHLFGPTACRALPWAESGSLRAAMVRDRCIRLIRTTPENTECAVPVWSRLKEPIHLVSGVPRPSRRQRT